MSDASEPRGSIWVGRTLRSRILGRFRVFRPKTCIFNTRTRQKITVLDVFRCFRATARREAPQKCQNDVKYTFSKGLLNSSRNYAVPLRYNKISDPFRNQKSPIGSRWDLRFTLIKGAAHGMHFGHIAEDFRRSCPPPAPPKSHFLARCRR